MALAAIAQLVEHEDSDRKVTDSRSLAMRCYVLGKVTYSSHWRQVVCLPVAVSQPKGRLASNPKSVCSEIVWLDRRRKPGS